MLKASRFNVLATNEPLGGVLYNTLYGSVTEIEPEEWPTVQAALADPDGASSVISEVLVSQHHLVDAAFDELAVVRERKQRGIDDPNRLDVVVMPTLDCNFRCVYCYEDHVRSTMTDDVEVALCRWLDRQVPSAQLTMLHWFGGEPLLCTDRVVSVSKHLAEVAREHGVGHVVHITTNGFLLDGARRAALLAADIVDYQVTNRRNV